MKKHLPGLDAIRAIAAFIVLFCHIDQRIGAFSSHMSSYISEFDKQNYAVTIFFVLSGFLITLLLLEEKKVNGTISLRNFYMRRVLKIWPLYFFILILSGLISFFYPNYFWKTNGENYIYYLLFIGNVAYVTQHWVLPVSTFWSIGVEEQFYLFWPFLIKRKNIIKGLFVFFVGFCFLKIVLRYVDNSYVYWLILETRFSCMAIGGFGAYLYFINHKYLKVLYNPILQLFSWLILISVILYKPIYVASIFNPELYSIFFLVIIVNMATNQKSIFVINHKLINYLGKISYGIYCWHMIVIIFLSAFIKKLDLKDYWYNWMLIFIVVISVTIIVSHFSFEYFEKKFLNMKNYFTTRNSSSFKIGLLPDNNLTGQ